MAPALDQSAEAAEFFKALGDETRVRMVALLSHGELCVCHLVSALELPQSTVSRQLAVLRRAGLVAARREGTWMHYALANQKSHLLESQLAHLREQFCAQGKLRRDVERLLKTRGPGKCG
jgi:ArsR family transcriptional regulator